MKATINPETVIPTGMYCYKYIGKSYTDDGILILRTHHCPFWSLNKKKPKQANGYCSYLGKGDWDLAYHPHVTWEHGHAVDYIDTEMTMYGLIWDCCKECGVNDEWEDEDEE